MSLPNRLRWTRPVRALAWLALIAQAIAAWFAVPWVRADALDYLRLANDLAHGSFGSADWPEALRPPGYPMFLALLHNMLGLSLGSVVAIQLAIYLLTIWLIARFLRGTAATLFLCFAALYPFTALYSSAIMAEAIAALLFTGIALLAGRKGWQPLALAGALSGLLALCRPDFALLPVLLAGIALFSSPRLTLVPLVAGALVMAPYAIWNDATFGKLSPLPVAGAVGSSLYLATWQDRVPLESLDALYAGRSTPAAEQAGLTAEVRRLNARIGAPPLTAPWNPSNYRTLAQERASVPVLSGAALARIKADPAFYARHVLLNAWRLWNSSSYPHLAALLTLVSGLFTLLGGAGLLLTLWSPPAPVTRTQAVLFLYVPAVHVWLHTEARYTAAARPMLVMFAAVLVAWLIERASAERRPQGVSLEHAEA